jgi:hypothetical protein
VRKMLLIAMLMAVTLCSLAQSGPGATQRQSGAAATVAPEGVINLTITTGGGMYGPVKSRFKVGDDIPVSITMTNTSDRPAKYCLSTTLFQNRPQLKRGGRPMQYLTILPQQADKEDAIQRCERSAFKQLQELQPKQTRIVDWLTFSQRGIDWYGALQAGHYELVLLRRIECCQGPWVESNKVTFEIVP